MRLFGVFASLLTLAFMISACGEEEFPEGCQGTIASGEYGFSYAKGSYKDFGSTATFVRDRLPDTINGGWMHDDIEKGISLDSIQNQCILKERIRMINITSNIGDTTYFARNGIANNYFRASFRIVDDDAGIESYNILADRDSWLIIDAINADTTEIEGRFELSFVTTYEDYLNGERERWDDPNRPDTLRFTNGQFRAEFQDY